MQQNRQLANFQQNRKAKIALVLALGLSVVCDLAQADNRDWRGSEGQRIYRKCVNIAEREYADCIHDKRQSLSECRYDYQSERSRCRSAQDDLRQSDHPYIAPPQNAPWNIYNNGSFQPPPIPQRPIYVLPGMR